MSEPINPLDRNPAARRVLYDVQWGITGLQTVFSAFFAFMYGSPTEWPEWFLATLAVLPVLWSYLGITAKTNVTPKP